MTQSPLVLSLFPGIGLLDRAFELEEFCTVRGPDLIWGGDMLALQGLPADFLDHCPFTVEGKRKAIGNGVPIPMGRALARAVRAVIDVALA